MRKPDEDGNMKPLVVNDDAGSEFTPSEISCPKELDEPINRIKVPTENTKGLLPNSKRPSSDVESDQVPSSSPNTGACTYSCNSIASITAFTGKAHHTLAKQKAGPLTYATTTTRQESVDERRPQKAPARKSQPAKPQGLLRAKACRIPSFQVSPEHCRFCLNVNVLRITYQNLYSKYEATTQNTYNVNVVNDIILNSNTHITANFKDYLIYDDSTEFVKEFLTRADSLARLRQTTAYYDKSTRVFPNYVAIDEKKYIFKNIDRKQKAINARHKSTAKSGEKPPEKQMFTRGFIEEEPSVTRGPQQVSRMGIAELVDRFIDRDSLSMINQSNCTNVEASFVPAAAATGKRPVQGHGAVTKAKKPLVLNVKPKGALASKPLQINNWAATRDVAPASAKPQLHHHQSQEQLHYTAGTAGKLVAPRDRGSSSAKPTPHASLPSGRTSAAGYYRSYKKKEPTKPRASNLLKEAKFMATLPRPATVAAAKPSSGTIQTRTIDVAGTHININLNLNLNFELSSKNSHKEQIRSGTPQTCVAADTCRLHNPPTVSSKIRSSGLVTSRAAAAQAKASVPGKARASMPAGKATVRVRPESHMAKRPAATSGRSSAVPTGKHLQEPRKKDGFLSPTTLTQPATTKSVLATPRRQTSKQGARAEAARTRAGSAMGTVALEKEPRPSRIQPQVQLQTQSHQHQASHGAIGTVGAKKLPPHQLYTRK